MANIYVENSVESNWEKMENNFLYPIGVYLFYINSYQVESIRVKINKWHETCIIELNKDIFDDRSLSIRIIGGYPYDNL